MTQPDLALLEDHPNFPRRACRGQDPNNFFPGDGELWRVAKVRMGFAARTLCVSCPLLAACRSWGVGQGWGLWGGVAYRREGDGRVKSVDFLKEDR